MTFDSDYLQALRDCCESEAAFERLQQLLGITSVATQKSRVKCQTVSVEQFEQLQQHLTDHQTQLQQKTRELQELKRLKEFVLHTIAHDFRTSVIGTLMVCQNLLKETGLNNEQESETAVCQSSSREHRQPRTWISDLTDTIPVPRKVLERMVQGNERQLTLINTLLQSHTGEEPGIVMHPEIVEFSCLVQEIVQDLQPLLAENQASLLNQVPQLLPAVLADPIQLHRVFEYLLVGILKQNPPGVTLTLSAKVEGEVLRCLLQDDGVGMSQTECNRLFELRIRNPQSRCSMGVGVNLFLCKQIILAHGGEIGASSSSKRGSSFWFTLPLAFSSSIESKRLEHC